jgi:hypothetical protein
MSGADGARRDSRDQRPEFMAVLGLLPPYALEDVKRAYHDMVRTAHPDHGGSIAEFRKIQNAYEEAQRYVTFRTDKRAWIAAQMDRYLAFERLEEQLKGHGAEFVVQQTDWLRKSYGDFSELTASIQSIRLADSPAGREIVELLVVNHAAVANLKRLELTGCGVTDESALRLACLQMLETLDLSHNPLTRQVMTLADTIPTLATFCLDGTSVGWLQKVKLAHMLRKRSAEFTDRA